MRFAISLVAALVLFGCSSKEIATYDISTKIINSIKNSSNKVLKVKYPTALSNFGSSKIYFKKDGITSYYLYSSWSDSFSKILYKNLLENLEDAKIFKSVVPFDSSVNEDLTLEVQINNFYHYVNNNSSYLYLSLNVRVLNRFSKLIKSRSFEYKLNVYPVNAKGFKNSAKKAVEMFLRDLYKFIQM